MSKKFAMLLDELNERLNGRFTDRPRKSVRAKNVIQQGPLTLVISPEKEEEASKLAKVIPITRERR